MGQLAFTQPWLLLFLLLLPLLFWKPRRSFRPLETDRLALWQKALERMGGGRGRSHFFPRLLNSLIFVTLVVAAAGPKRPERPGVKKLWQVLDASPSMAVRTGPGESRWSSARARSQALRRRGGQPTVPSRSFRLQGSLILPMGDTHSSEPGLLPARPLALLPFAAQAGAETAVVFWGDGAGPSPWPKEEGSRLFFGGAAVGRVENQGFRSARVEDPWPDKDVLLFFSLVKEDSSPTLRMRRGVGPWEVLPLSLPKKSGIYPLRIPRGSGGPLEIALSGEDPFQRDQHLVLMLRPPPDLRVTAVPPDKAQLLARFLRERCGLSSAPPSPSTVQVQIRSGGNLLAAPPSGQVDPASRVQKKGVLLCLGTQVAEGQRLVAVRGAIEWNRNDPLLKGLDLSGFVPKQVLRGDLPAGFRVLARLGKDPLLVVHERRRLLAFLGTLPHEGLFRQPFFPILCLRFLGQVLGQGKTRTRMRPLPPKVEYAQPGLLDAHAVPAPRRIDRISFFVPARPYAPFLAMLALGLIALAFFRVLFSLRTKT